MKTFHVRQAPMAVATLLVFSLAGSAVAQAPPTKLRTKWAADVTPTRVLPDTRDRRWRVPDGRP